MSRSTPYWTTSTNLNRKKSQSQPAVKQSPKVSLYESVRTFLWKNPLKRNGRGQVRNPHKADEISNKISTGIHKRTKSIDDLLGQCDEGEEKRFSEDDDDETVPELKNEVEMDDGEEDWEKEMEQQLQEKAKSNRKTARRRLSGGNLLDTDTLEPSEQVDVDMDQQYNFIFTQKCQIESSTPPAGSGSNRLLFQQNDLSKSVNFESLGGFKGHHTTSFLI